MHLFDTNRLPLLCTYFFIQIDFLYCALTIQIACLYCALIWSKSTASTLHVFWLKIDCLYCAHILIQIDCLYSAHILIKIDCLYSARILITNRLPLLCTYFFIQSTASAVHLFRLQIDWLYCERFSIQKTASTVHLFDYKSIASTGNLF